MRTNRLFQSLLVVVLCAASSGVLAAQEQGCGEIVAMAGIARARSSATMAAHKQKAGDSYRAQVVSAARALELRPMDKEPLFFC